MAAFSKETRYETKLATALGYRWEMWCIECASEPIMFAKKLLTQVMGRNWKWCNTVTNGY